MDLITIGWIGFWMCVIMTAWVGVQLLINHLVDRYQARHQPVPIDWRPPHERGELPR
jgi:hypothetical protein